MALDQRRAGALLRSDLEAGFRACGLLVTPAELQRIFEALDVDRNQSVDWIEWLAPHAPRWGGRVVA